MTDEDLNKPLEKDKALERNRTLEKSGALEKSSSPEKNSSVEKTWLEKIATAFSSEPPKTQGHRAPPPRGADASEAGAGRLP